MKKRHVWTLAAFAWVSSVCGQTNCGIDQAKGRHSTNILAFYLVLDDLERYGTTVTEVTGSNLVVDGLKVMGRPILSDIDFVGWNITNHSFVINSSAALRLYQYCQGRNVRFVLEAFGALVYQGEFVSSRCELPRNLPMIYTDGIPVAVRTSPEQKRAAQAEVSNAIQSSQRGETSANSRQLDSLLEITNAETLAFQRTMATTNEATNAVTLEIQAPMQYISPDGTPVLLHGQEADPRVNISLEAAVKMRFENFESCPEREPRF